MKDVQLRDYDTINHLREMIKEKDTRIQECESTIADLQAKVRSIEDLVNEISDTNEFIAQELKTRIANA